MQGLSRVWRRSLPLGVTRLAYELKKHSNLFVLCDAQEAGRTDLLSRIERRNVTSVTQNVTSVCVTGPPTSAPIPSMAAGALLWHTHAALGYPGPASDD